MTDRRTKAQLLGLIEKMHEDYRAVAQERDRLDLDLVYIVKAARQHQLDADALAVLQKQCDDLTQAYADGIAVQTRLQEDLSHAGTALQLARRDKAEEKRKRVKAEQWAADAARANMQAIDVIHATQVHGERD